MKMIIIYFSYFLFKLYLFKNKTVLRLAKKCKHLSSASRSGAVQFMCRRIEYIYKKLKLKQKYKLYNIYIHCTNTRYMLGI